jgi:hypothetical protein
MALVGEAASVPSEPGSFGYEGVNSHESGYGVKLAASATVTKKPRIHWDAGFCGNFESRKIAKA